MLHQDKSHARIVRQIPEQLSKSFQAAGGCADSDDGAMLSISALGRPGFGSHFDGRFCRLRRNSGQAGALPAIRLGCLLPAGSSSSLAILSVHKQGVGFGGKTGSPIYESASFETDALDE
jgi:hypothetical protein